MSKGRIPEEGRLITYAREGKLYELTIVQFVILQSFFTLQRMGEDTDPRNVSEWTGRVAAALEADGWFTPDEYAAAWAESEAEDLDTELEELTGE